RSSLLVFSTRLWILFVSRLDTAGIGHSSGHAKARKNPPHYHQVGRKEQHNCQPLRHSSTPFHWSCPHRPAGLVPQGELLTILAQFSGNDYLTAAHRHFRTDHFDRIALSEAEPFAAQEGRRTKMYFDCTGLGLYQ